MLVILLLVVMCASCLLSFVGLLHIVVGCLFTLLLLVLVVVFCLACC